MAALKIRVVEELALKGPGEVGTGYVNSPLALPLPSTVAGALAAAGWVRDPGCSVGKGKVERFKSCMRVLGVEVESLRGPFYVNSEGAYYLWVWPDRLVRLDLNLISRWVNAQLKCLKPGKRAVNGVCGDDRRCREEYSNALLRVGHVQRTSARLVRVRKIVDEGAGALFKVPYIYYGDGSPVIDLFAEGSLESRIVVRIGGENRVAVMEPAGKGMYEVLRGLWRGKQGGQAVLVVATPLLFNGAGDVPGVVLDLLKSLKGIKELKKREVYSVHPSVKPLFQPFQPGFDEVRRVKDVFRVALVPGAAFIADVEDWELVYRAGVGDLRELGYGTLVPLPLRGG